MSRPAVVLLSGGLDSATTLAITRDEGFRCHAMSFRYGQRHRVEIESATRIAAAMNVAEHRIIDIDLRSFGGSALTADIDVPAADPRKLGVGMIPVTYVPARNTLFLAYALAWAEVLGARDIFIGVNAVDYSGYPDCRPEYIQAFEHMANLGTKAGVEGERITIHAPLIDLTKQQIIARGLELGVDYGLTSTCYDPDEEGVACGRCEACYLRLEGFAKA
ncbi:MAG: 7-cyano-7-deazaguanine synthase QueC, partial [Gemmatimonadales bacterium]